MPDLTRNYTSFIVDSHVTDHDDSFQTKLDPETFVARMKQTGVDSAMVYATCHNGNCYYKSKLLPLHKGLKGRDYFGETTALLRKNGIIPKAYHTIVYQRQIARAHPEWRVYQVDGSQNYRRSWHCCPNNPGYREFATTQLREICSYPIDGIFIDMTFWPGVCVCPACRSRFLKESGKDIPAIVDWNDATWVLFQRRREAWLAECAREMTAACKSVNPKIAVAHQFSPVLLGWMYGQSTELAQEQDIPSGDFYGGKVQQRFGCKLLASFEKELPFEYMTSRCVTLYDHTSTKSDEEMLSSISTTLAHGGTHTFIDAINPDGTLEKPLYDRLGHIAAKIAPVKARLAKLQPKLVGDTAIYFSMRSHYRREHSGSSLRDIMNPANNMLAFTDLKPLQEVLGTSAMLHKARMPFRVINDRTSDFTGLNTIILNDCTVLDQAEEDRLRRFVADGGTLIATGLTSLQRPDGSSTGNFTLADVFGVNFTGKLSKHVNYIKPRAGEMISNDVPGPLVTLTTAEQIAEVVEPLFEKDDFEHFASYHSNPPGKAAGHPAITVNRFGKGNCIYCFSSFLAKQQHSQLTFGASLMRDHAPSKLLLSCDAPASVEATILRSKHKPVFLIALVDYQEDSPVAPIHDISLSVAFPDSLVPIRARRLIAQTPVELAKSDRATTFNVPKLQTIEVIEVETEVRK